MSVFEFSDYKKFLDDLLRRRPLRGRGEVSRIGAALSVHPTLVSQVLRGKKDFSLEQAHGLAAYLGLSPLETDFFLLLVQKERAGTRALRLYYEQKITGLKADSLKVAKRIKEHRELSDTERAIFYSTWLYSAVRLFTSVGKGQTLDAVAVRFTIGRKKAREILDFLVNAGLCAEQNGIFTMGTQHTHLAAGSPFLSRHHANWRVKALERSEGLEAEELMFTSPFSVSAEDFQKIREQILALIQASSLVIRDSPAEEIACLSVDLFRVR